MVSESHAAGPDLSSLPGFGDTDLVSNEAGRLTDVQTKELRRRLPALLVGGALCAALAVWLAIGRSWFGVALAGLAGLYVFYEVAQNVSGMTANVRRIEGSARLIRIPIDDDPDLFYALIEDMTLETTATVYGNMPTGGPYRVYFVERRHQMVNARALPGWQPASPLETPQPGVRPAQSEGQQQGG